MIVYGQMSAKRKTRSQKIKASQKITEGRISYSLNIGSVSTKKEVVIQKADYHLADVKKILIVSGVIFAVNILLFILLSNNLIRLGFLSY